LLEEKTKGASVSAKAPFVPIRFYTHSDVADILNSASCLTSHSAFRNTHSSFLKILR